MLSLILLTLGTGVGGGIIIGDLNVSGAHSHGSECGHIVVDASAGARRCPGDAPAARASWGTSAPAMRIVTAGCASRWRAGRM